MANSYTKGALIRVQAVFADSDGTAVDPTTVTFKYQVGVTGTPTSYIYGTDDELVRTADGTYHVDLDLGTAAWWYYYWTGTGAAQAAQLGRFCVLRDVPA